MTVPHTTARLTLAWLRPPDIARELDVTRETARKIIRRIPGAELLYRTDGGREKWRVSRVAYEAWRKAQAA